MTDSANIDDERRQSFRIDMEKELVDISWTDENGNVQQRKIVCLDFSRGGLKVDCDHIIPIGTAIEVLFKAAHPTSQKLSGKVLRCIQDDSGWFHIALQLDE
ncbi:MAG: PilZ domain-containing protein [Alteromonadaceae bacterium]|nr:PilZ domain-containing protein [Alteromonadaceae bacterium]